MEQQLHRASSSGVLIGAACRGSVRHQREQLQHFEAQRFEERDGGRRHVSPSPNSFVRRKPKLVKR